MKKKQISVLWVITCDKNTSQTNCAAAAASASVADYSLNAVSYHITLFWSSLALRANNRAKAVAGERVH